MPLPHLHVEVDACGRQQAPQVQTLSLRLRERSALRCMLLLTHESCYSGVDVHEVQLKWLENIGFSNSGRDTKICLYLLRQAMASSKRSASEVVCQYSTEATHSNDRSNGNTVGH